MRTVLRITALLVLAAIAGSSLSRAGALSVFCAEVDALLTEVDFKSSQTLADRDFFRQFKDETADLKQPAPDETRTRLPTEHGHLESGPVQKVISAWISENPALANALGLYSGKSVNEAWIPDAGEFNFRVSRLLRKAGLKKPIVKFQPAEKIVDSSEYSRILSENAFPFATPLSERLHDIEHGIGITLLSLSPNGRKILRTAYARVQLVKTLKKKLEALFPELEGKLQDPFYEGTKTTPSLVTEPTIYIERGTFGITEVALKRTALISKGDSPLARVRKVLRILGHGVGPAIVDSGIVNREWSARHWDAHFTEFALASELTGLQKAEALRILGELDAGFPRPSDEIYDKAAGEIIALIENVRSI